MQISNWLRGRLKPDLYVDKYLKRWWIVPKNNWFNIYLHKFEGSDHDRALHDHPFRSISFLLSGSLDEEIQTSRRVTYPLGDFKYPLWRFTSRWRNILRFFPYYRKATAAHRIVLHSDEAWTLFITGMPTRVWGFWTKTGWLKARDFFALGGKY